VGLSCVELGVAAIPKLTQEQTHVTKPISPLRQRMIDNMTLRKRSPKTQSGYIRAVKNFTHFLGRSPDSATAEELRRYQRSLVEKGIARGNLNSIIIGLKFFFDITLGRPEAMVKMCHVYEPRKLPVVLSREEVAQLIESAGNLKYQAALAVAYGASLRASEVVSLKVGDIDSDRMLPRVEQDKGRKDRYMTLSPVRLAGLRDWWRTVHAKGKMLSNGWLFPGQNPINPLSTRQLNRACHMATAEAKIKKRVSLHTCRHAWTPIGWNRGWISASSRSCSGIKNSRPPPCMPRWPPRSCVRSSAPWYR
jgi:integrase